MHKCSIKLSFSSIEQNKSKLQKQIRKLSGMGCSENGSVFKKGPNLLRFKWTTVLHCPTVGRKLDVLCFVCLSVCLSVYLSILGFNMQCTLRESCYSACLS